MHHASCRVLRHLIFGAKWIEQRWRAPPLKERISHPCTVLIEISVPCWQSISYICHLTNLFQNFKIANRFEYVSPPSNDHRK